MSSRPSQETGRKRSRASRNTPPIVITTDLANYRAVVQQYTVSPSAIAFGSDPSAGSSQQVPPADGGGGGGGSAPSSKEGTSSNTSSSKLP
ncbi:hypothetical protein Bca4012_066911 [Brassica carinata]|uniref:VQ domain-containing protein n=1 Tax=Brassica carinata TaxID=52824 RepID=A0A8X7VRJ7_BRACI|nr:hypothetical protein Bca52824_019192 [Brassica carinata]